MGGIERLLKLSGCPNPTLDVSPFWYPYNVLIKADRQEFTHTLGKRNTLYNIIRYIFNHPWENAALQFAWLSQLVVDGETQARVQLGNDNIYVFNPFNRYFKSPTFTESELIKDEPEKGEFLYLESIPDDELSSLWTEFMQ